VTGLHVADPALVVAFRRDGAASIRGAFSRGELDLVESAIERNLAEPSERALVASRPGDPGRFFEDFCNWQRLPELEEVVRSSPAAAIAGELMGSDRVRFYHDHVLVKEPGTAQRTPWHQPPENHFASSSMNVRGIVAGAPMEHPLFPVVWERGGGAGR
jgi:ectoine hydroxylase-related dioxygenase (phytanoyl-CoA dioxygenase family)